MVVLPLVSFVNVVVTNPHTLLVVVHVLINGGIEIELVRRRCRSHNT